MRKAKFWADGRRFGSNPIGHPADQYREVGLPPSIGRPLLRRLSVLSRLGELITSGLPVTRPPFVNGGAQNFPLLGGRDLTCPVGTRLSELIVTSGVLGLNRPRNENMKARPLPPVQAAAGTL